jgi:hypothetical protein
MAIDFEHDLKFHMIYFWYVENYKLMIVRNSEDISDNYEKWKICTDMDYK